MKRRKKGYRYRVHFLHTDPEGCSRFYFEWSGDSLFVAVYEMFKLRRFGYKSVRLEWKEQEVFK